VPLLRIGAVITAVTVGAAGWVLNAAEHRTAPPLTRPALERPQIEVDARARRALLTRAQVRLTSAAPAVDISANPADPRGTLSAEVVECQFLARAPSGTTPKFDCVLADGEVVKVKYGRNPELHAEAATTHLLTALGYPADHIFFVPTIRCYGCPRYPFFAMRLLSAAGMADRFPPHGWTGAYTDFQWPAVERRFESPAVVSGDEEGWGWWELKHVDPAQGASRADVDALRLLAVFLAHWDNKAENQRIVCDTDDCRTPFLMLQDVGSTFGPSKVNLARWRSAPIWLDRAQCRVTMRSLPYAGATFSDVTVTEGGRASVLRGLARLTPAQVRGLFQGARFPEFHSATSDERDLDAWSAAFAERVQEIAAGGPCPEADDGAQRVAAASAIS
jgi:hypothetical protein